MLSVVLFATVAHADMALCEQLTVSNTLPQPMQEDVPIDARVALDFQGGGCAAPTGFDIELDDALGNVVASESIDWGEQELPYMLVLEHPDLEPDSSYVLRITARDGWGELTEVAFTTGSGRAVGIEGNPNAEIGDAVDTRNDPFAYVELYATPVADPEGLSWLEVRDSEGVVQWRAPAAAVAGGTGEIDVVTPFHARTDTEACVEVVQIDGRGVEHATEVCKVPVPEPAVGRGCDTTGQVGTFATLAALLLTLVRRKA